MKARTKSRIAISLAVFLLAGAMGMFALLLSLIHI